MNYKANDDYYFDDAEKQHIKHITLAIIFFIMMIFTFMGLNQTVKKNEYLSFMYIEECTSYGGELIYVRHTDQPKCYQHEIILNDYYSEYIK